MKVLKMALATVVATATVVALGTTPVSATSNHNTSNPGTCDVPKLKLGEQAGKRFSVSGNQITATFEVTGTNCTTDVTLAVWSSPVDSLEKIDDNVSNQTLFGHATGKFGPGTHTLTTTLPNCFYQADLLTGSNPKAPDGTPNYAYQNGVILSVHPLRDYKFGGDKKCVDKPEEPKTPPKTPEPPKTGGRGAVKAKTLTVTGPESVLATAAGVSVSGAVAHAIVSRKKRQ